MKLTFIAEDGHFKCTMETETLALHEILDEFKQFLLGAGYIIDSLGSLQVVGPGEIVVEREGPTHE